MSTLLYGKDEVMERMKRETMEPNGTVAIDHDFYSENPERHSKHKKHHEYHSEHHKGESKEEHEEHRLHRAMGGAAKIRRDYPMMEE